MPVASTAGPPQLCAFPADLLRPFFGMRDLALPTFDKELRDLRPIPLDITEVSRTQAQLLDAESASRFWCST